MNTFRLLMCVATALLSAIALLSGCGTAENPEQAQTIETYLRDNFGTGHTTSWYPSIKDVSVRGNTVSVYTDIASSNEAARGICRGTSGYVFSKGNSSLGLSRVQVLGAGGNVLIDREGIADKCS